MSDLDFYGASDCDHVDLLVATSSTMQYVHMATRWLNFDPMSAGFPLRLSAQQAGARARCDNTEKKVLKSWFKYAKKGQVPSGDERKKLCRKVRMHWVTAGDMDRRLELDSFQIHQAASTPLLGRSPSDAGLHASANVAPDIRTASP